jgi:RNA polymerase sigma-70 factor, ECF subfamily
MPSNDPADDPSDAILVQRIRDGSPAALEPLYRRHGAGVYRFALLWSGSTSVAADVTQEVFMHVLTHAADFDAGRGRMSAYLCGVARNFVRRQLAMPVHDPLPEVDDDRLPGSLRIREEEEPLPQLLRKTELELLRKAIARLPAPYRDALILVELHGCSYVEAASICGCELGTIRSRLSRARTFLADKLADECDASVTGASR